MSLLHFGFSSARDEVQSAVPADSQEEKEQKEPTSQKNMKRRER